MRVADYQTFWDIKSLENVKDLKTASKAFEEEFLHIFLKEVRKTVGHSGLLGDSFSSKMYLDMFDMQIAKALSDSDQFGIKEYIQKAVESYSKNGNLK